MKNIFNKILNTLFKIKSNVVGKNLLQIICDYVILKKYHQGHSDDIGKILLFLQKYSAPTTWAITFYIGKVVFKGNVNELDQLIKSKKVRDDHKPLLISAKERVNGNFNEALRVLNYNPKSRLVMYKVAQATRSIHHQMNNTIGKVDSGIKYILQDKKRMLLDFSLHIAGSAQNINNNEYFLIALKRAYRDLSRFKKNKKYTRDFWREAVAVALHLFDIDLALSISRRAKELCLNGAEREYKRILGLNKKFKNNKDLLLKAKRNLLNLIKSKENQNDADVIIVFNAAALRFNNIDYSGFRDDIIFIYKTIADCLNKHGISYDVVGKFIVHGELNLDKPYFSYHSISSDGKGLHFKEYDRPHCFSFDNSGYSGWASVAKLEINDPRLTEIDSIESKIFFEQDSNFVLSKGISKYKQKKNEDLHLPSKFIFVALQIDGDAVQSLAYRDTLEMLDEVTSVCLKLGTPLVVKRHPYCKSPRISEYLKKVVDNENIFMATGNIHKLIEKSSAVCVINSAVGSEALLHKKIVYSFGRSEYMGATVVCEEVGDFEKKFNKFELNPTELEKFWYFMRTEYSSDIKNRSIALDFIERKVVDFLNESNILIK